MAGASALFLLYLRLLTLRRQRTLPATIPLRQINADRPRNYQSYR